MNYLLLLGFMLAAAFGLWSYSDKDAADTDELPAERIEEIVAPTSEIGVILDAAKKAADTLSTGNMISIYDGISVVDSTTKVDLSGKGLVGSLKAEIRHLKMLEELNLSHNSFTGLPAEVGQLSKLKTLNLSNNPFTGLPREIGNLSNLRVLDLRGTKASAEDVTYIKSKLPQTTTIYTD